MQDTWALGFFIFLSTFLYVDYQLFIRSGDSKFFEDQSQIEKDLREIQKIELKQKLEKIKGLENGMD